MDYSANNQARAEQIAQEHRHDVEHHLEELEQRTKLAEQRRQEHLASVAQQARHVNHSEEVLERAKELEEIEAKITSSFEEAQQKQTDEQFEFNPAKTAQIHQEIVQIRKDLHDFSDQQHDMVELLKDELKQAKAAEQRREFVKTKVPQNLEDRIEHAREQHLKHDIEKVLEKEESHKSHENHVADVDARRAALLNERINKAKYLATRDKQ